MAASYTADNLLIAKLMYDRGFPLPADTTFYEEAAYNDSSLFWKAIKELFTYEEIVSSKDNIDGTYALQSEEIQEWYLLKSKLSDSSHYSSFRKSEEGLESILEASSDRWELSMTGEFTSDRLILNFEGDFGFAFFHSMTEAILDFKEALSHELQDWRKVIELEYEQGGMKNARGRYIANSA
jgi:hypothetical protein